MSNRPKVLVTGATGNIGSSLISTLALQYRSKFKIFAGVHQPNDTFALQKQVDKIFDIDYDIPSTMETAMSGIQYLFLGTAFYFMMFLHSPESLPQSSFTVQRDCIT